MLGDCLLVRSQRHMGQRSSGASVPRGQGSGLLGWARAADRLRGPESTQPEPQHQGRAALSSPAAWQAQLYSPACFFFIWHILT